MKGLRTLTAIALGIALLASAAAATAATKRSATPSSTTSPAASPKTPKPAHICQKPRKKGAFFRSNRRRRLLHVCVKFPTKKNLCAPKQEAKQGTLYVNKITSTSPAGTR